MKTFVYLTLCVSIMFAAKLSFAAAEIQLVSEENPPFNYTDEKSGKFIGIETEMVEKVFKRAGVKYSMTSMPWLRAYNSALGENNTCVFMTAQTGERLPLFKWVGPFLDVEWVVYQKKGVDLKVSSIEDLKKLRVGGYFGDGPVVFLQGKGVEMDLVQNDALNPKKLEKGRIDAWVTNSVRGPLLAKKQGVTELKKLLSLKVITHFVACNKGVADSTIEALNREVKKLKASGFIEDMNKPRG